MKYKYDKIRHKLKAIKPHGKVVYAASLGELKAKFERRYNNGNYYLDNTVNY